MPRVRQTWAAVSPWGKATSASRSFPMICSGVNCFLLISLPPFDLPEPKTVITFEGNHMGVGPDKMALLQKIIATSKNWLIENGAINHGPN
jgi:hypothetical protein